MTAQQTVDVGTRPGQLGTATTRVLLTVLNLHCRAPSISVRDIGRELGYTSPQTTWRHLERLRAAGLVTWEPGTACTIRPIVTLHPLAGRTPR